MNIALDVTPIKTPFSLHGVRGAGAYINLLVDNLRRYDKKNSYIFFTRGEKLPKNIDLIHYPYFDPFFLTLPFVNTVKTVITVHDLIPLLFPKHFPAGIRGNLKWQIQKLLLKKASFVITDSFASKNDIVRILNIDSAKVSVVYLAAAKEFRKIHSFSARKKYNLPKEFVLYVGDVTWNKNLPRLIRAVKKIHVPLVMAGKAIGQNNFDRKNPWNHNLLEVCSLIENNSNFIRLGFVPLEDLVYLYNEATVFAMPSLYEGFGLPVLEAMSCGCPVVTARTGSLPEIAGDAVFYVDPQDEKSIALGIEKVLKDKNLQLNLSAWGIKQAEKFSIEKTIKNTVFVYEKVVNGEK